MENLPKEICLRCGAAMELTKRDSIQLGSTGWMFGNLGNLIAGSLDVEIYTCSACGKLEFYTLPPGQSAELQDDPARKEIQCPRCGATHCFYDLCCPACGYRYKAGELAPRSEPENREGYPPVNPKKYREKPDREF